MTEMITNSTDTAITKGEEVVMPFKGAYYLSPLYELVDALEGRTIAHLHVRDGEQTNGELFAAQWRDLWNEHPDYCDTVLSLVPVYPKPDEETVLRMQSNGEVPVKNYLRHERHYS